MLNTNDNPLKINLFHKDTKIGSGFVDLSVFFKSQVEEMPFGSKHEDKVKIHGNGEAAIGSIEIEIILEKEECYTCKSCKFYYKVSNMLKHFGRPKNDCKKAYNETEIQTFNENSEIRKIYATAS